MSRLYKLILGENCTVPNGTVIQLVPANRNVSEPEVADTDDYNAVGAMEFTVATILLYAFMGVFCTLLIKIKRSRGQSHYKSMMDESVNRYLKEENMLKFDGQRTSLRRACRLVSQRIEEIESETQARLETERELSSDMTPEIRHKKLKKKRRKNKTLEMEEASLFERIGNIDVHFVAPGSDPESVEHGADSKTALQDSHYRTKKGVEDTTPGDSFCDSLESVQVEITDDEPFSPLKTTVTDI